MKTVVRAVRVRGPVALVTLGAGLVVASAAVAAHDRPPPADFGRLPVVAAPSGSPSTRTTTRAPAVTTAKTTARAPAVSATAPTAAPVMPTPGRAAPAPPSTVAISALGVRASVLPVHALNGVLGVPADPRQLGWWADGAPVGAATGVVVIDGHVDSAVSGVGALFDLTGLQVGDSVLVTTTLGQTDRYVVTARRRYLKQDGLPPELFRTDGPAALELITCGGPFDRAARSYLDNIVVFAAPAT